MRVVNLNPGPQHDFVVNDHRHSGYFGGRGAGKTFALVVRGLRYAYQDKVPGETPPVGMLLTDSFPHLKDIVYPAFYKVAELSGIKYREVKNQSDRKFILDNGAEILMRSLDNPERVRGPNLAWFGIDEGRTLDTDEPYKLLLASMRQSGYKNAGFVTSTPNGFDWQWKRFHPDSPHRRADTEWYNAPTFDNSRNLPKEFIKDLEQDYDGLFYQQEVMGEFVGAIGGAVWPMFDPRLHSDYVLYDPHLPLYAGWDFGIGDAGVCLFAQLAWKEKVMYDGSLLQVPSLRVLDVLEAKDLTVREWANEFFRHCDEKYGGRLPNAMWGDPAGTGRNQVTGTSTIASLNDEGVFVRPAPKRPIDEGIIIVQNLMDRPDGFVLDITNPRLQQAVQTYHWKIDEDGNRLAKEPVHDWTSHICSALRYMAIGAIGLHPRRTMQPTEETRRGTMGYIMEQLREAEQEELVMNAEPTQPIDWHQDRNVGLDGLL